MGSYSQNPQERNFDDEWKKAQPTVVKLLNRQKVSQREWQDLFMTVHNIYSWVDLGVHLLRDHLHKEIEYYIYEAAARIAQYTDNYGKLDCYAREWTVFFEQSVTCLPLPFKIADADKTPGEVCTVREAMLKYWHDIVFKDISTKLLGTVGDLIDKERNDIDGLTDYGFLITSVRDSYVHLYEYLKEEDRLNAYKDYYEKEYIRNTISCYRFRAANEMQQVGIIKYMNYADMKLHEEKHRGLRYLCADTDSQIKLMDSCVKVLVTEYQQEILAECAGLIEKRDVKKLRMLYRLIQRTPTAIESIVTCIYDHIRQEGVNDMMAHAEFITTDPEKYVQQLLEMFDRFTTLVSEGFYDDARLLTARDKAFREVVNDTKIFKLELPQGKKSRNVSIESKCPELLANYCDLLLRKSSLSKKLTSEEIDEGLEEILLVLKYVNNKDVFMRFYKGHIHRRLVLDTTADLDKEEMMIARLRESGMPAEHVSKLSRMLQDVELNKDLNVKFKKYLTEANSNRTPADLINLKVLNAGAWSRVGAERVHFTLPREMEDFVPEVEAFYKSQHNGRKLTWMHNWSTGTIAFGTANGGRFDLDVTAFQMAVMCQFNDRGQEKLSLETIRLGTELPDTELCRTLMSLTAFPKLKSQILLCDAATPLNPREFNDSTRFWVNHDFHLIKNGKPQTRGRLYLIGRFPLAMEPTTSKEHEDIVALREFRVQEGIVKIMKMRKTMTSAQLETELIELLKPMFLPNKRMYKEQVEFLIENKFIERKAGDMNTFIYIT